VVRASASIVDDNGHPGPDAEAAVSRVLAALRAETDEPFSLSAMAEIAGLSPFHFARRFRHATGVPPGQFQAALRLERAKRLLLTTDLSATEVCYEVGYESVGTFTSRFAELVGVSPGRLRHLPDLVADIVARPLPVEPLAAPTGPDPGAIVGRVHAPELPPSLIFVGLFPHGIAQRVPLAGALLLAPGPYRLAPVPDGRYHVLAAALPAADPLALLLPGAALRVGHAPPPVVVAGGRTLGPTDITLRPPLPTEPPLLVAVATALLDPNPIATARRR